MPLAPAGVNFHGSANGAWAQTIPLPERTNEILYYRAVADGGYLDDGDQVVYVAGGSGCGDANRANYPVDLGEGNDHGGFVNLDVNGFLSTTVNLLESPSNYQACYYKPTSGSRRRSRELNVVFDAWSPIDAFLSVSIDGEEVLVMSPPPPSPPPFQYYVMDSCGSANNALAEPVCVDPGQNQGPALPMVGLGVGGVDYSPTGGTALVVRCCFDDPLAATGFGCDSESAANPSPSTGCYANGGDLTIEAKTWAEARDLCENDGRRLCSVAEMITIGSCCGSGCSYDNHMVWTGDVCNFSPESPPSPRPPPPSPPAHPPAPPLCEGNTCHICDTRDLAEQACATNDFLSLIHI